MALDPLRLPPASSEFSGCSGARTRGLEQRLLTPVTIWNV